MNRSLHHLLRLFFILVAPINRAEMIIRTIFCPAGRALLLEFLFGESLGHVQLFGVGHCSTLIVVAEPSEIRME